MKRVLTTLVVLTALLLLPLRPAHAQPPAPPTATGTITVPVSGTTGTGATFTGTLTIEKFAVQDGVLVAVGKLTGTLRDAAGNVIGVVTDLVVNLPVTNVAGECPILHLEIGPIDLDLLGLVVHVDRIVVDITAEAGPGKLLGNLLCAVARLLDTNAALTALAQLLNNLLGAL